MTIPDPREPVQFRVDGSMTIDIDDEVILWRPPRMRHQQDGQNGWEAISKLTRDGLEEIRGEILDEDPTGDDTDRAEAGRVFARSVRDACEAWVRKRHKDLAVQGDLPDDIMDWPTWLPRLDFVSACVRHWGETPFGSSRG